MATQPEDDEPLELTEQLEPGDEPEEQPDEETPEVNDEGDEQPSVSFEGEEPEEQPDENSAFKRMREQLRDKERRIRELEKATAPKPVEIGEEPTLEGCDYDGDRYKEELRQYDQRKAAADRQNESQAEQSRKANEEWQADLGAFEQKKAALQFDDAADIIDTATLSLNMVQQAVIVKSANDPALFLYALGKSEAKRAELAKIEDPIKLAAAVARMEGAVKVTTRKAPAPDRPLRGSATIPSGGGDKELERLEKEADRTGDRTAFIAAKRARREAEAAKGK